MFTENNIDPIAVMGIGREITKEDIKLYVKGKLSTNKKWATTALLKIFEKQTEHEKETASTHVQNNVGFNGTDAQILTSFAIQLLKRGFLTPKQLNLLYKKIPKYWAQIVSISNQQKLELQIRLSFNQ